MADQNTVFHTLEPVYDAGSRILILGTMPSPKSRENGFYYAHPMNRFWRVLAAVTGAQIPKDNDERRALLLSNRIALFDVLKACSIAGASDSSIRQAVPNDIKALIDKTEVKAVFTTGQKAYQLYQRLCYPATGIEAIALPSTSPANAGCSLEKLIERYSVILDFIK